MAGRVTSGTTTQPRTTTVSGPTVGPTQATTAGPPVAPTTTTHAGWTAAGATSTQTASNTQRAADFGKKLAAGGAQSITLRMKKHNDAIEKTGIGVYYGDHSSFKKMTADERKTWVTENAKPGTTPSTNFKEASCIGWVFENVGAAYAAAGKADRWKEILKTVASKGSKGIDLAKELQKDGWEAVYWNPDAKNPSDGNAEHSFSASQVAKGKGYYGIEVVDSVINYRPTDSAKTKESQAGIDRLKKVPFFFGVAKGGVHTFVGRNGNVNEFHWSEMPNSTRAIEEKPLKEWGWNSGLIMVPPGTWPAKKAAVAN